MKITVLMGSPNQHGTTAALCEAFAAGARSAGHTVEVFAVDALRIAPCTDAFFAALGSGESVDSDGMEAIMESIRDSGVVVFASPVYFFGMTAQLKAVVDRFCAHVPEIQARQMKAVLIATAGGPAPGSTATLEAMYEGVCSYLKMADAGRCVAASLFEGIKTLQAGNKLKEAERLGASL